MTFEQVSVIGRTAAQSFLRGTGTQDPQASQAILRAFQAGFDVGLGVADQGNDEQQVAVTIGRVNNGEATEAQEGGSEPENASAPRLGKTVRAVGLLSEPITASALADAITIKLGSAVTALHRMERNGLLQSIVPGEWRRTSRFPAVVTAG